MHAKRLNKRAKIRRLHIQLTINFRTYILKYDSKILNCDDEHILSEFCDSVTKHGGHSSEDNTMSFCYSIVGIVPIIGLELDSMVKKVRYLKENIRN